MTRTTARRGLWAGMLVGVALTIASAIHGVPGIAPFILTCTCALVYLTTADGDE